VRHENPPATFTSSAWVLALPPRPLPVIRERLIADCCDAHEFVVLDQIDQHESLALGHFADFGEREKQQSSGLGQDGNGISPKSVPGVEDVRLCPVIRKALPALLRATMSPTLAMNP
jgi:hypothetical protein